MSAQDAALASLENALRDAVAANDPRAESVARVNLAYAYLQLESPKAGPAFDEALASVRRAQNTRSEGLLSIAFAPHFADQGDAARALELAQRGEQIMRTGRIGHRVLANIQLARVMYTAFADAEQAGHAVDVAVSLLADAEIMNPTDREMVIQAAGPAAKAALAAGDTQRTLALMRIIDPAAAYRLTRQASSAAAMTAEQRRDAAQLYAAWQSRWTRTKADRRVASMNEKAVELLKWDRVNARHSGASKDADGVCAFIERVQSIAAGRQATAPPPALTDDDLVFVLALATDSAFSSSVPAAVVFQQVAASSASAALVARCYRLAAAIGHERRSPADTLALLQHADAALADGVDDELHAEVANEIAVCLLNLRQAKAALQASQRAVTLSQRAGQGRFERMARGNVANALLQLTRIGEAMQAFEALARDQDAAGERDMAEVSRQNIEACRTYLRTRGEVV